MSHFFADVPPSYAALPVAGLSALMGYSIDLWPVRIAFSVDKRVWESMKRVGAHFCFFACTQALVRFEKSDHTRELYKESLRDAPTGVFGVVHGRFAKFGLGLFV